MKSKAAAMSMALLVGLTGCITSVVPTHTPRTAQPPEPFKGGTIYVLSADKQWDQIDPQRVSSPDDEAFFASTIYRSLESYTYSPATPAGSALTPDLATDIGHHNANATQWSFTLRAGVTWQDGSPITCADAQYGVSRAFATDVITNQGPAYAPSYLKIPTDPRTGNSRYPGPYKATPVQQALFDQAVTCDGKTITFNLNTSVPDFNYVVTHGFEPVPKVADGGERNGQPGHLPVSSGPYQVESYIPGKGGRFVLVRNPRWNPASDTIRKAYPDRWEVDFGVDPKVIDQRLISSVGDDAMAIALPIPAKDPDRPSFAGPPIPAGPIEPSQPFVGRAVNGFDPYSFYLWVDVQKVPDVSIRRAMWVALDRAALRDVYGGVFADGVISPSIGQDYAPTGLLDGTLDWLKGRTIPGSGDPNFAKHLIGLAAPHSRLTLTLSFYSGYFGSPQDAKAAMIVRTSLERAGFKISLKPETGCYCGVFDPDTPVFGFFGWRAEWPSASTVIPPLFASHREGNYSQVHDAAFDARIEAAVEQPDRAVQATMWQALNNTVVENMYVLPTIFSSSESLAGTKVGGDTLWPAYNTWPFGAMYVKAG